ncbi:MAG TPA: hypothetical protein PKD26_14285 [Pyrinomonadaceae bacterium]|nr:hypothetical protein [Pyrinomonadaceae bacterium]
MIQLKTNDLVPICHGDRRVDLRITSDEAVIRMSRWVDGLGWCGEKTMHMDEALLEDLQKLIAAARIRLRENRNRNEKLSEPPARILGFPAG